MWWNERTRTPATNARWRPRPTRCTVKADSRGSRVPNNDAPLKYAAEHALFRSVRLSRTRVLTLCEYWKHRVSRGGGCVLRGSRSFSVWKSGTGSRLRITGWIRKNCYRSVNAISTYFIARFFCIFSLKSIAFMMVSRFFVFVNL